MTAAGMASGAFTAPGSGYGPAAAWLTVTGLGMGVTLPAAMGALSAERAGVGSAVLMTVRLVGGAFGVAVLGSLRGRSRRLGPRGGDRGDPRTGARCGRRSGDGESAHEYVSA